jgi:hypothetical protein
MESLIQWFAFDGNALAVLVTVGVAVLAFCGLECMTSPRREKDDIFNRHAI